MLASFGIRVAVHMKFYNTSLFLKQAVVIGDEFI